jgi:tetratricopeptide (TPR) repeat protein
MDQASGEAAAARFWRLRQPIRLKNRFARNGMLCRTAAFKAGAAAHHWDGGDEGTTVPFLTVGTTGGVMAHDEPMIVVFGTIGGGTSAVAGVLHHLGVFMGAEFGASYRELQQNWEDAGVGQLCRRAVNAKSGQLQMEPRLFQDKLRAWADGHRRAARAVDRRPGVKHPLLCAAIDLLDDAWGPIVPVVVDRPFAKVLATLKRLDWWPDEQDGVESTTHLLAARDLSLANRPRVHVDFEELRTTPVPVIRRLADELGLVVTHDQLEAAADSIVGTASMPRDVDPFQRFIDQLMPAVERNPEDVRSLSLLGQVYFDSGDHANARKWYERMLEVGGSSDEETFLAMFRIAESMEKLGAPWHQVQDAYLLAWDFRPARAEPLYCIARHHFNEKRYRLAHLFGEHAAAIPRPDGDMLLPYPDIYAWRAADAQAKSAFCLGEHAVAFTLWRQLLAFPDIPDSERQRIAGNRDEAVPAMIEAASGYPDPSVRNSIAAPDRVHAHHRRESDPEVTVTLIAGPDLVTTQQALNSFLNCCADVARVGRFLLIDAGLSAADLEMLEALYEFVELAHLGLDDADAIQLAQVRELICGRFWLHLDQDWRFFAPEKLITRLTAVLDAEPDVFQVAINLAGALTLTGASAPEDAVRRTPDAGRYVLLDGAAGGPAMFDIGRLDQADRVSRPADRPQTASLDEVLCIAASAVDG